MSSLLDLDFGAELTALESAVEEISFKVDEIVETEQAAVAALAQVRKLQTFVADTKAKIKLAEAAVFTEAELNVIKARYQEQIDTAVMLIEEAQADELFQVARKVESCRNLEKGREAKSFYQQFDEWLENSNVLEVLGRRLSSISKRWADSHDGDAPTSSEWDTQAYADIKAFVEDKFPNSVSLKDHEKRVQMALKAAHASRNAWRYDNNIGGYKDRMDAKKAKRANKQKRYSGLSKAEIAEAQELESLGVVKFDSPGETVADEITAEMAKLWDV